MQYTAIAPVGAPGLVAGVTGLLTVEDRLVNNALLVAVTAKVYAVPLVNPLTVIAQGDEPTTVQLPIKPPGLDVAV